MLLANALNSGNPLVTTYGAPNTQAWHFDPSVFVAGLQFYGRNDTVLALIVIPAVALAALALARRHWNLAGAAPALVCAAANWLFTMAFLISYGIRQAYYPVPVAVFTLSMAAFLFIRAANVRLPASEGGEAVGAPLKMILGAVVVGAAALIVGTLTFPVSRNWQHPDIDFSLPPRSVVWAGNTSGYFYVFLDRQAAVLHILDAASQDALIAAIARDGVPQYVIAEPDNKPMLDRLKETAKLRLAGEAFGYGMFEILSPPQPSAAAN
jgi:hypothetical protein